MTGPRKHPCYPGTDRPILIGDTAHDCWNGRSGVVVPPFNDGDVGLELDDERTVTVPVEWLRYGPAPEPEPPLLFIRPTWAELRSLVRMVDSYRDPSTAPPLAAAVVDAIPADEIAAIRAEIEAGL